MKRSLTILAALLLLGGAAHAARPGATSIGKFGSWEAAYFKDEKGNKVCYMTVAPASSASEQPVKGRSKDVLFFVTQWPGDGDKNAVTIATGYAYRTGVKAVATVSGKDYALSTGGPGTGGAADMAWIDDNAEETELVGDIRKAESMTVKGTSKRGNIITDTYNLKGAGDAYDAISKACAVTP